MELRLTKNVAAEIMFPMIDSADPNLFKSGLTVADTAYYKDGVGSWTSLAITDTITEIGTTGMYTLEMTATELNHDLIMVKLTSAGAADSVVVIRTAQIMPSADIGSAVWGATLTLPGQVAPSNTPSAQNALGFMYKLSRNRITQTSSQTTVYNDDGSTIDHKATISDDATTFERGEFAAGP